MFIIICWLKCKFLTELIEYLLILQFRRSCKILRGWIIESLRFTRCTPRQRKWQKKRIQYGSIVGLVTVERFCMNFMLPWHTTCKSQTLITAHLICAWEMWQTNAPALCFDAQICWQIWVSNASNKCVCIVCHISLTRGRQVIQGCESSLFQLISLFSKFSGAKISAFSFDSRPYLVFYADFMLFSSFFVSGFSHPWLL